MTIDGNTASWGIPARVYGLDGATNFRDLGGYPITTGGQTEWGQIYRSNALCNLTSEDVIQVEKLQLRSIIDLRTSQERKSRPNYLLQGTIDIYGSKKEDIESGFVKYLLSSPDVKTARTNMTDFYSRIPDIFLEEFTFLFRSVAANKNYPLLVHCSAGKDRTGVASALLLSAAGVERSAIEADYLLSIGLAPAHSVDDRSNNDDPMSRLLQALPPEVASVFRTVFPENLTSMFESIETKYGGIDGYLLNGLNLTEKELSSFRVNFVE